MLSDQLTDHRTIRAPSSIPKSRFTVQLRMSIDPENFMSTVSLDREITGFLVSKGLNVAPAWVSSFLANQRTTVPLPALKGTAVFRLIQTDITTTLQRDPISILPSDIHNAAIRDRVLPGPIPVQVLDIEDIGRSRWSQAELIESEERGETTRGREIIRVVPGQEGGGAEPAQLQTSGPHKLLLQDVMGVKVYAIEVTPVAQIGFGMSIGAKMVLKNVTVARGVLILEPKSVTVLGGKLDDLHKSWKEKRKESLKTAARAASQNMQAA
jgi:RecQ-mediated genome instability protein 1